MFGHNKLFDFHIVLTKAQGISFKSIFYEFKFKILLIDSILAISSDSLNISTRKQQLVITLRLTSHQVFLPGLTLLLN